MSPEFNPERRQFIKGAGATVVGLALGLWGIKEVEELSRTLESQQNNNPPFPPDVRTAEARLVNPQSSQRELQEAYKTVVQQREQEALEEELSGRMGSFLTSERGIPSFLSFMGGTSLLLWGLWQLIRRRETEFK